jgi:hypothetical protein
MDGPGVASQRQFTRIIQILKTVWGNGRQVMPRIVLDGRRYQDPDFVTSRWIRQAPLMISSDERGLIEVHFAGLTDTDPFSASDDLFLGLFARQVGRWLAEETYARSEGQPLDFQPA